MKTSLFRSFEGPETREFWFAFSTFLIVFMTQEKSLHRATYLRCVQNHCRFVPGYEPFSPSASFCSISSNIRVFHSHKLASFLYIAVLAPHMLNQKSYNLGFMQLFSVPNALFLPLKSRTFDQI